VEVRPALPSDAGDIVGLLQIYAAKGQLLERTLAEVTSKIRDFTVAVEGGDLLGVAALHAVSRDLAEIRSLAVQPGREERGLGTALVEKALKDAARMGVTKVFALTYRTEFFEKMGFTRVDKQTLPQKIWRDCMRCAKYPDCDEVAVIREVP
jgi:amino-acid N-acetyltransferase